MLGILETDQKKELEKSMLRLLFKYIQHKSTGFSTHMLLFGREPRLPVDLAFALDNSTNDKPSISNIYKIYNNS